jgi:hypothetical protein
LHLSPLLNEYLNKNELVANEVSYICLFFLIDIVAWNVN